MLEWRPFRAGIVFRLNLYGKCRLDVRLSNNRVGGVMVVPMKRVAFLGFWACLWLLLLCLSIRLLWLASRTETGFQTLHLHWRDATLGWVQGSYKPIHSREPPDQAEFWLREVGRVLEDHPDDASIVMGAALVLDSPGTGFLSRHVKKVERIPGFGAFPELDREEIRRVEDTFENQCKQRCLELAGRAAELDPANVEWWRLRALLLWRHSLYSYGKTPRDPRWINTLQECAQHDPDNALYDYLAAYLYWEASAEMDFSGVNERLVVKDAEGFESGINHFERGQAKPYFAVGDDGFSAVAEFLRHTPTPLTDHEHIVNSRGIHPRRSGLLHGVWRWQRLRADGRASVGDVEAALALKRQNLHLIGQYTGAGDSTAYDQVAMACKAATAATLRTLADEHRASVGDSEMEDIVGFQEATLLEQKVLEHAGRELAKGKNQPRAGITFGGDLPAVAAAMVVGVAPSLVVLLLLVGLAATILSRCSVDGDAPVVGPIGQISALLAAITVTIVLFGLAPAEIISRGVQSWVFTVCLILVPILVASWIGWRWLRYRAFQFSLRAMLICTFFVSLLFSFVSVIRPVAGSFADFPFDLSVPARGWEGLDNKVLGDALTANNERWLWAVFQWAAYYGHYLTLAIWAGLVVALQSLGVKKLQRQTVNASLGTRKRLGGLFRSLARPALVLAAIALMTYLVLTPNILKQVEQEFQQKIAFARHPESHWEKVEKAIQKVRSDEKLMEQFREIVKAELSKPADSDSEQ